MAKNILDLLDEFEPRVKAAFISAIQEITSKVRIGELTRALERGDVAKAIELLYIDTAAYRAFERELAAAYEAGGVNSIEALGTLKTASGTRFVVRFDARNFRAERWLRDHSSELVTRIVTDQRDTIRGYLVDGLARGDNPNTTALDVVGRIGQSGRREGGIIGLSGPQENAVRKAREELQEGRYSEFLQRARRDKRFDRVLAKAAREGRQLTKPEIEKMLNRYSDRLLQLRGQTIARTETLASLNAAQHESIMQVVDTGNVRADQITRVWDSAGDLRVRFDHAVADGQKTTLDGTFYVGGRLMKYPGDPNGGAHNTINCRCVVKHKINFLAGVT